jgi:transposase
MPVRVLMTPGTTADWMPACRVSEGLTAAHVRAARGYDSEAIVAQAKKHGRQPVMPPRKNRKAPREDDTERDRLRHLVENAFLPMKHWRGMATRYAKTTASFLAAIQIRCLAL